MFMFSKMAEVFSVLYSGRKFKEYIEKNKVRPDGRPFDTSRPIVASIDVITSAEGSAVIRLGNTLVACGIKAELAPPKAECPNVGILVTNFEMPPLCSTTIKPGPPSDLAQSISTLISEIIKESGCLNYEELCIENEKLAWVLYCDIICLNNDGSLLDAALMSLLGALHTVVLPTVNYDIETEEISVSDDASKKLKLNGFPVASSFTTFGSRCTLMDPSFKDESECGGPLANLTVVWDEDTLCGVYKLGGVAIPDEHHKQAIALAQKRSKLVKQTIQTAVGNLLSK